MLRYELPCIFTFLKISVEDHMKFLDFDKATKQDWLDRVKKELKGKAYETLLWNTGEGFQIDPLYTAEEQGLSAEVFPIDRGEKNYLNSWTILQEHIKANTSELNKNIITSLNAGVQGLVIDSQNNVADYRELLSEVKLDWIKVFVRSKDGLSDLNVFEDYLKSQKLELSSLNGSLMYDPLGDHLGEGSSCNNSEIKRKVQDVVKQLEDQGNFGAVTVDGSYYGDHGSSITNELAYTLAQYHEYLLMLSDDEKPNKDQVAKIQVNLSVGRSYLMEIAKIKVFRMLHQQLLLSYELEIQDVNIISKSSKFEQAPIDSYNNLLRLTSQAMSAGIGGADDILLDTYDGKENPFSQRMSINIQLMLIEESFVSKGHDISRGSYVIEKIINELLSGAWEKFQEIESNGGWTKSVESGQLQKDINADQKSKVERLNDQSRPWLGVNLFKNKKEKDWQSCEVKSTPEKEIAMVNSIEHKF